MCLLWERTHTDTSRGGGFQSTYFLMILIVKEPFRSLAFSNPPHYVYLWYSSFLLCLAHDYDTPLSLFRDVFLFFEFLHVYVRNKFMYVYTYKSTYVYVYIHVGTHFYEHI